MSTAFMALACKALFFILHSKENNELVVTSYRLTNKFMCLVTCGNGLHMALRPPVGP
jgi:hypothetical protein